MADAQPSRRGVPPVLRDSEPLPFKLGQVEYAALEGRESEQHDHIPLSSDDRWLTAVPTDPSQTWSRAVFEGWLASLTRNDDLDHPELRTCLLFCGSSQGSVTLSQDVQDFLVASDIEFMVIDLVAKCQTLSREPGKGFTTVQIAGGPYLWSQRKLHAIYRLYEDRHGAFFQGLQPASQRKLYRPFFLAAENAQVFRMAVPTRCPAPLNGIGPLVNKRVLIKDIFKMEGLKVGACNLDYLKLARNAKYTAPTIQRLIDAGALIIGKAKLSSMISREEPSESLRFPPPMNPRGDGMQSPAGSSSGSAVAVASYDWVDFAIGSDSTGSTRRPAMANGVYSLRITTHRLPSEGMMSCFGLFDAPSVLARSLKALPDFVKTWCGQDSTDNDRKPISVFVPLDFTTEIKNKQQVRIFAKFAKALAACFGIEIRTDSIAQLWETSPPPEACGATLHDHLRDAARDSFFYDFYHTTDKFRNEHWRCYGSQPAVNKVTAWRWKVAENISLQRRNDAVRRLDIYRDWLRETVLGDNTLVILPVANAEPNYRDEPPRTWHPMQEAWDQLWLAPILGAPELTVPIGQVPYFSRISQKQEWLPVVASILGTPGSDVGLIKTAIKALEYAGLPTEVLNGKHIWEPPSNVGE